VKSTPTDTLLAAPPVVDRGAAARVGIVGLGHVGRSVQELLGPHVQLITWDISGNLPYPGSDLEQCDYVVVAVNTPTGADGAADVGAVAEAVGRVPCNRVLLKSTTPPGTTDWLASKTGKAICHWPEFISESRYHNPYFPSSIADIPFVILGGQPSIRRWFVDRLMPILGPAKKYFQCTATEAELIKYAINSFFAMKVVFANEFRRISEVFDADWHTVREGWLLDPRVAPLHTAAFQDSPGFGGRCLPKDLRAIIAAAATAGYAPTMLEQVIDANELLRRGPTGGSAVHCTTRPSE